MSNEKRSPRGKGEGDPASGNEVPPQPAAVVRVAKAIDLVLALHVDDDGRDVNTWWNHRHDRPGIWNADNGPAKANKPCEYCAAMRELNEARDALGVER